MNHLPHQVPKGTGPTAPPISAGPVQPRNARRCSPVIAALLFAFVLISAFSIQHSAFASNIRFAWTNWQTGLPLTNTFVVIHVGTINSEGGSTPENLPMRVTPQPDGLATNRLPAGNYMATNSGAAVYFTPIEDSGPTVYSFTQPGIWRSGGNYFIQQIITNGGTGSVTFNAITNGLGYTPPQGSVLTNSFDPTNSAATAATAERAALILTNAAATAAIISSNTLALTTSTNLTVAERNALISSNTLALAALSATNTAILGTATNLTTAERAALIATNSLALAAIIATNTANLTITTNLTTAERSALIASNSLALASLALTNTAILTTATNLSTAERAALIATNTLALAAIIATNTANLTITTNLTVAERNALIATNNILLADILSATNGMLSIMTNIAQSVSGSGNFVAINNGIATNPIVYGGNGLTITNSAGITIIGNSTSPTTWSFKQNHANWGSGGIGNNPPTSDFILTGPTINEPVMFWITNAAGHGNMIGMALQSVYLSSLWLNGVQVTNLNGATGSVGAGAGVTVTTNGTAYIVAANSQTNLVVFQSAGWTNGTLQSNLNLGGLPLYLTPTTNIVAIWNAGVPSANGNFFPLSAGLYTNLDIGGAGNGSDLKFQNPSWFLRTNLVNLYSASSLVAGTTWANVIGSTTVPSSSYGYSNNLLGIIFLNFTAPSNLVNFITNAAALAAKQSTNVLSLSAYQGVTNNDSRSISLPNGYINNASNLISIGVPSGAGFFTLGGGGQTKQQVFDLEEIFIGNGGVAGDSFIGLTLSGTTNCWGQSDDGAIAGAGIYNSTNCYVTADAGSHSGGYFENSVNSYAHSADGSWSGGIFIDSTNCYTFAGAGGWASGGFNDALNSSVTAGPGTFMGMDASGAINANLNGSGGFAFLFAKNKQNVSIQVDRSIIMVDGVNNFTNSYRDSVGVVGPNGNFNGVSTNGFSGNGFSLTNLNWAITNGGLTSSNYANSLVTNTATTLSNLITTTVAGTTNLTKFTITSNLLIAGVSQEQIFTGKIVLRATNGVPWSLVYFRFLNYWTNFGSAYSVITNGNGTAPQWNLKDASGNTLSFKPANSSPQGPWTANFIATNAPTGDWGRYMDFRSGGFSEPLTISNAVLSGPLQLDAGSIDSSGNIVMNGGSLTFMSGGNLTVSSINCNDISGDGGGLSGVTADMTSIIVESPNQTLFYCGLTTDAGALQINSTRDGHSWTNIVAQPGLTFSNNTIYSTTNTAGIFTKSNPTNQFVTGVIYTGPPNRGQLVGSLVLNSGVSGSANITILYTNNGVGYSVPAQAGAGLSTTDIIPFDIPLGTNATFQFISTMGTGATGWVTNGVVWNH